MDPLSLAALFAVFRPNQISPITRAAAARILRVTRTHAPRSELRSGAFAPASTTASDSASARRTPRSPPGCSSRDAAPRRGNAEWSLTAAGRVGIAAWAPRSAPAGIAPVASTARFGFSIRAEICREFDERHVGFHGRGYARIMLRREIADPADIGGAANGSRADEAARSQRNAENSRVIMVEIITPPAPRWSPEIAGRFQRDERHRSGDRRPPKPTARSCRSPA